MTNSMALRQKGQELLGKDNVASLNFFQEALILAEIENNEDTILDLYLDICFLHRNLSNMKEGFESAMKAAQKAEMLDRKEHRVRAFNFMGIFCFYIGLYKRALHYFFFSLDLCKNSNYVSVEASVYNNLGETYMSLGKLEQALVYFNKALDLINKNSLKEYLTPLLCNIGSVHLKQNKLLEAENFFNQAYIHQEHSKDSLYCAELDFKMGLLWLKKDDAYGAYSKFLQSEEKYRKINNRFYLIDVLIKMAELEEITDSGTQWQLLNEAKKLSMDSMTHEKISNIEFKLHESALKKGDFETALTHYKLFHESSSKSDARNLLAKLEIMNIESDFSHQIKPGVDLQDFANLDIFGDCSIDDIVSNFKDEIQYKALTDDLTGLPNRRKINEKLFSLKGPHPNKVHGMLLIDIDHFKTVNDSEGHLYGDRCLVSISRVMHHWALENNHFVGRYGGEEFLCLVENTEIKEIPSIAEELRALVEEQCILYKDHTHVKQLTVSIGCINFTKEDMADMLKLVDHADQYLYKAKSTGRNRVYAVD